MIFILSINKVGSQYSCQIQVSWNYYLFENLSNLSKVTFDNLAAIFDEVNVVPKTDKRESKEETENSTKFCHKVGQGVDQLFCLYLSFAWY